jgi:hypothetical protein
MASAVDIKIVANTRQAQRGIKQLGGSFKKLDQQTRGLGTSLSSPLTMLAAGATAAAAAVAALAAAVVKNAVEVAAMGDEIAKTARATGLSAEQFQKYAFAAERGGVSQAKMSAGLKVLSRNLLEAQQGSKQMQKRFEDMGVQIQNADGSLRSTEQVLGDVANRVQLLGVSSQTTAELMQVMGRSGADLTNVLLGGEAGLKAMGDEAERLGGIMSEELLDASEEYQDAITDLQTAFGGLRNELAEETIPQLTELAKRMTTVISKSGLLKDALSAVGEAVSETRTGKFGTLFAETQLSMLENLLSRVFPKLTLAAKVVDAISTPEVEPEFQGPPVPAGLGVPPTDTGVGAGAGRRGRRAARPEQLTTAGVLKIDPQDVAFTALMGGSREDFERATAEVAQMQRAMYDDWAANEEMKTAKAREEAEKRRQIAVATAEAQNYAAQEAFGAIATFAGIAQQAVEDSYFGQTRAGKDAAKALFATAKLAALAGATVNTALAITNALANVPAPANIAAAVGVGIAGAAEIGVIAATAIQGLADGGLAPGVLKKAGLNNHTVIGIRNDEAVIDPVGTKEITQMLSLQRRQMEMNLMGSANDSRPVVIEMDGRRLTRSLEPHLTRSVEDGSDFRQNVRFAGAL